MKSINLRGKVILIDEFDHSFAKKLSEEYKLSIKDICLLIYFFKRKIDFKKTNKSYQIINQIIKPKTVIQSICLNTNNGQILISDRLFILSFYSSIYNLILSFDNKEKTTNPVLKKYVLDSYLRMMSNYFDIKTNLTPWQKQVAIGMICVHCGWGKRKPIMTEVEFIKNPTEAQDYKHYLSDTVKSWMKNLK